MDSERRSRFRTWFELEYGHKGDLARAEFIKETGQHGYAPLSKGRISQIFDEREPFGEEAARQLALRLGKPEDFFLRDRAPSVREPQASYVVDGLADLQRINPQTHDLVLSKLRAIIESARASRRAAETLGKTPRTLDLEPEDPAARGRKRASK